MKNRTSKDNTIVRKKVQTRRFNADIRYGLNSDQVNEYFENGWSNEPVEPPSKTVPEIIKSNLFTYFNLVFAVLAALLILAGSFRNLTFLPVILANLFIGIIQEIRAKNTLDKLSVLNAPKALVVREGRQFSIPAEELVLDDIVIFKAGNQICADAIVVDGEVSVNESLLTGESDEISKKPGDELMSGSFIVSGECYARLDKVGEDSYISKLTLEAKAMNSEEQSEMIRVLDKLVGVVGILIIPIGLLLFGQQFFFSGASFSKSITSMVAAVIGMIPEGLYLLASVALVVSVMRLASKKVLVHDMKCIETLARVNVLCVDKTGTITENDMTVTDLVISTAHFSVDQCIRQQGAAVSPEQHPALQTLLECCMLCTTAEHTPGQNPIGDPTETALLIAAEKAGFSRERCKQRYPLHHMEPFDSETKKMEVTVSYNGTERQYLKGAADRVLPLCTQLLHGTTVTTLTESFREEVRSAVQTLSERALRVLAFAYRE